MGGAANQSFQITSVAVGNPNLDPEKADTMTFGAVFRPSFDLLSGLQLSADYYNIKVEGCDRPARRAEHHHVLLPGPDLAVSVRRARSAGAHAHARVQPVPEHRAGEGARRRLRSAVPRASRVVRASRPQTFAVRAFASRLLERSNIPTPGAPEVRLEGGFDLNSLAGPVLYPHVEGQHVHGLHGRAHGRRSSRKSGSAARRST